MARLRASPDKVSDLYAKFGRLDTAVNQVVSLIVNQPVMVGSARHTAVKASRWCSRTLERRAADHDGAGLGSAVRVGEVGLNPRATMPQGKKLLFPVIQTIGG